MKTIRLTPLSRPVNTAVTIPSSKSFTNRALVLAAITDNPVTISNPLLCDDTEAMISCLRALGIKIIVRKNALEVTGSIKDIKNKTFVLDANLSGTTFRFILPLLTIVRGIKILKGKEGLNKRPIGILVNSLHELGADIAYLEQEGFPPLKITRSTLRPGHITLDGNVSSQYVSALIMILPFIGNTTITTKGIQVSRPYIDMTIDMMKKFGVYVKHENNKKYIVSEKHHYNANRITIEGDFSSAGYFLAIAALTKSTIILRNLNPHSLQPDRKILDVLRKMGNKIILEKNEITIIGNGVRPINIDVTDFPDSAQTLAVLAAFAKGTTKLSGIQTLRIKETDRVQALQNELGRMKIKTIATEKTLTIFGGSPEAAKINTYGDHRMAMAFAIAASALSGMKIANPDVVAKTFPNFWKELQKLGIKIYEMSASKRRIVLIGFMGSGKSSVAPLLAEKLGMKTLEMDSLVLKKSQEKSIKDVFEKFGESHFRNLEEQIAKTLGKVKNSIVSTGGGVVMNDETMKALCSNATVVFLSTTFETIQKRLPDTSGRPMWNDITKTKKLFEFRKPLYEKHANCIVDTNGKSLENIVREIIEKI